jgi:hypothetical protein
VPAGTVTPLENVNGRNARRLMATGKKRRGNQYLVLGILRKGIERTRAETIKPLGLPEETVYLVHLVYPSFRPAFFSNHGVDLLAEGFDIFRIGKKTVQTCVTVY